MGGYSPEREVPSLDVCKKLREQGFPQDGGGWYWLVMKTAERTELASLRFFRLRPVPLAHQDYIKAPTFSEIGGRLPGKIGEKGSQFELIITRDSNLWVVYYSASNPDFEVMWMPPVRGSENPAEVCANVWLALKERIELARV